jgi:hypothetical protein
MSSAPAPAVLACSACTRSFVVRDARATLADVTGGCPVCGKGRWRRLGPEWPRLLGRLRSILGIAAGRS